jgi:hypothetical protein
VGGNTHADIGYLGDLCIRCAMDENLPLPAAAAVPVTAVGVPIAAGEGGEGGEW